MCVCVCVLWMSLKDELWPCSYILRCTVRCVSKTWFCQRVALLEISDDCSVQYGKTMHTTHRFKEVLVPSLEGLDSCDSILANHFQVQPHQAGTISEQSCHGKMTNAVHSLLPCPPYILYNPTSCSLDSRPIFLFPPLSPEPLAYFSLNDWHIM